MMISPKLFVESEIRSNISVFGVALSKIQSNGSQSLGVFFVCLTGWVFLVFGTFLLWTFQNVKCSWHSKGWKGCFLAMDVPRKGCSSMQWATLLAVLSVHQPAPKYNHISHSHSGNKFSASKISTGLRRTLHWLTNQPYGLSISVSCTTWCCV